MQHYPDIINIEPSPFKGHTTIEYFDFEEDFIEENMRCIPMTIRYKMDKVGIKLKLSEWNKFTTPERLELAVKKCSTNKEQATYSSYLSVLIRKYTGNAPTLITANTFAFCENTEKVPDLLKEKTSEFGWKLSITQWMHLTILQRYALIKLCRPGHENKNFPIAFKEFGLVNDE
jgi:hypothetical protein